MVALLGPNGSGKSTILNTISNLVHHRNGSIHFENNLISEIPTHKRTELGISHVLERRRVFPHLTVMQNLLLGAWHPKAKEQLDNSLSKIYKIFPKLEVRSSQLARTMSGGEQQRVAIARAFIGTPKILFADEPTGNLDATTGHKVEDLLFDMNKESGTTLVMVTHDAELAKRCQRIFKMAPIHHHFELAIRKLDYQSLFQPTHQ